MGLSIVLVDGRGLPVTDAINNMALPLSVSAMGVAVTFVEKGGLPVVAPSSDLSGDEKVTNGNFSGTSGAGWTVGLSGGTGSVDFSTTGQAKITGDGTNNAYIEQRIPRLIPGVSYVLTLTSVNTVAVIVGSSQGGSDLLNTAVNTAGKTNVFVAPAAGVAWLRIARGSTSAAFVSAVSVKGQG